MLRATLLPVVLAAASLMLTTAAHGPLAAPARGISDAEVTDVLVGDQPAGSAKRLVIEEEIPADMLLPDTGTRSLYARAGWQPPARVERLIGTPEPQQQAAESSATSTQSAPAATYTTPDGKVLPPGLRDHVNQACVGDGSDGKRVQVMYLREVDQPDRYAEVLPILRNEMRYIDSAFALASMETGGGRRVRWVTTGSCTLSVLNVVLPDGAITGTFDKTEDALKAAGYLKANRKYLGFADVPIGGMGRSTCGAAAWYSDSRPVDNLNDGRYPQFSRVDLDCWVTTPGYKATPLHELLHTLGALQPDAPNSEGTPHCSDGGEVMCSHTSEFEVRAVCLDTPYDIDCNNDDYFNTHPAPGSYLDTHWNVANSPFLEVVPRLPDAPSLRVAASTGQAEAGDAVTVTATTDPGTTVTWSTDTPSCEPQGAAKTGATFTLQCWHSGDVQVTATASNAGITVSYATARVSYAPAGPPELTVTSPATAPAGSPFDLAAQVKGKGTWTYKWTLRTSGCTSSTGTSQATIKVTCTNAVAGQQAVFTVAATRAADDVVETRTFGVNITAAGSPTVTITGPDTVASGQTATFTATVSGTSNPTYSWTTLHGYGTGATTERTFTVRPPANTTKTSDAVYLTVTGGNGQQVTVNRSYTITKALSVTLAAPSRIDPGAAGTVQATVSKPATLTWVDDQPACTVTPAHAAPTSAQVVCDVDFQGPVAVTVTATADGETATRSRTITVAPPPATTAATTLTMTASRGYPTVFTFSLRDRATGAPVGDRTVHLEQRGLSSSTYQVLQQVDLDAAGQARVQIPVTSGGYYRAQFPGDADYTEAASVEQRVWVATSLSNARHRGGLTARLSTGWGDPVTGRPVLLQQRVVGTSRWRKVKTVRTNRSGLVAVRMDPRRPTDYRWRFRAAGDYLASKSRKVRLR